MTERSTLFVDGPAAEERLENADEPEAKSRVWLWLAFVLVGVAMVGTVAFISLNSEPKAPVTVQLDQDAEGGLAELAELSLGDQAEVVEKGESAQERNDKIPFTTLALEKVAAFRSLSNESPSYDTALKCMTQAIYYEAAHEPAQGKRAVAQVVLNRMRHPAYPNSVCGVVYEGVHRPVCQFSFTCDGSLLRKPAPSLWQSAADVAKASLDGKVEHTVGTATHYHADYVLPRWAFTLGKITKIGRHIFYRFPGRGGSASAFGKNWAGTEIIPTLDVERLEAELAKNDGEIGEIEDVNDFVPGTTVVADVTDRHAENDVGGRLDTTKEWRLSIPDPVNASGQYNSARSGQGEAVEQAQDSSDAPNEAALAAAPTQGAATP